MTCSGCEETLERVVGHLPGVDSVRADHRTGSVEITVGASLAPDALEQAVRDAGYDLPRAAL
jgi:copper chaperone CopZ